MREVLNFLKTPAAFAVAVAVVIAGLQWETSRHEGVQDCAALHEAVATSLWVFTVLFGYLVLFALYLRLKQASQKDSRRDPVASENPH